MVIHPRWSRCALAPVAAAALLFSAPARAQGNAGAQAAERLFLDARALLEKGNYAAGCPKLEESLRLVERPGTLLNLAECAARDKHPSLALERLRRALALLDAGDERVGFAKKRIAELEGQVGTLVVSVDASFGVDAPVEVDGKVVARAALAGLRVDPGRHVIVVAPAGGERTERTVTVTPGERKAVAVSKRDTVSPGEGTESLPPPPSGSGRKTVGFVLLGVGVAGFIGAGATGGLLLSRKSSIDAECPDKRCSPEGRRLINETKPLLAVNALTWGVGIAGAIAGTILVVTAPRASNTGARSAETRVSFTPSPFGAGVALEREF